MRRDQYRTPPKPKIAIMAKAARSWGSVGVGRTGASAGMARDLTAVQHPDQMNYRNGRPLSPGPPSRLAPPGADRSFFVNPAHLYSVCRRKPAMAINGCRNKPIGPGGST